MKKYFFFLFVAMLCVGVISCNKDNDDSKSDNDNNTEQPSSNNNKIKLISAIQLEYSDGECYKIYLSYDEKGRLVKISHGDEFHSWTYTENSIEALEYIKGDGECVTYCTLNEDDYIKSYNCPFWEPNGCTVDFTYDNSYYLVSTNYSVEGSHSANWQGGNLVQIQTPWGGNAYCSYNNITNKTNLDLNWFITELAGNEIYTDLVGFDTTFSIVALTATGYTGKTNRNFLTQIKEIDGEETNIDNYTWQYDNNGYPISCRIGDETITFYYD